MCPKISSSFSRADSRFNRRRRRSIPISANGDAIIAARQQKRTDKCSILDDARRIEQSDQRRDRDEGGETGALMDHRRNSRGG